MEKLTPSPSAKSGEPLPPELKAVEPPQVCSPACPSQPLGSVHNWHVSSAELAYSTEKSTCSWHIGRLFASCDPRAHLLSVHWQANEESIEEESEEGSAEEELTSSSPLVSSSFLRLVPFCYPHGRSATPCPYRNMTYDFSLPIMTCLCYQAACSTFLLKCACLSPGLRFHT